MARNFTVANSNKADYGSPAVLDDLIRAGNATLIVVGRRSSDADNQYLASKTSTVLTRGWEFLAGQRSGGTTYGHIRLIIWTEGGGGGNYYDRESGNADTNANTMLKDEHTITAFTYDSALSGNGKIKLFVSKLKDAIVESTAYTDSNAGSGTPCIDNDSNYYGWNLQRSSSLSMGGDGAWQIVFNRTLSLLELRVVQQGVLMFAAGDTTRGINCIKSVSGYVMINHQLYDGTYVEYSGNTITPTLTGTSAGAEINESSSGANQGLIDSPASGTDFEDNVESGASYAEQTRYIYGSDFKRRRVTTTATAFTAWNYCTFDPASFPNQTVLGYDVNGAETGKLSATAVGPNSASVSGLSGSSKVLSFIDGPRSKPSLASVAPFDGTFYTLAIFDATFTAIAPTARAAPIVACGDSILTGGFVADYPQKYGAFQVLRRALPVWADGVISYGAGGLSWYDLASDSTKRADTVAKLTDCDPAVIAISVTGANDKGRNAWSTATATTPVQTLLSDLLAAFSGRIHLFDCTITLDESSTNSFGEDITDWRAFIAALPAAVDPSRITYSSMIGVLTTSEISGDNVHPTTAGHQILDTFIANLMAGFILDSVNDATMGLSIESPSLAQHNALVINDASMGVTADSPALVQHGAIAPDDAALALSADAPSLTQHNALAVADAALALSAEAPALVQHGALAVNDALLGLSVDGLTVVIGSLSFVSAQFGGVRDVSPQVAVQNASGTPRTNRVSEVSMRAASPSVSVLDRSTVDV